MSTTDNVLKGDRVLPRPGPGAGRRRGPAAADPDLGARSFLHPGKRIKLHPDDWYAYGAHRGGIDERWFASTTEAANEGRVWHEGLSFCAFEGQTFTLRDAVAEAGERLIGEAMFGQVRALAGLLEVLRQHGPDPAPHAPEASSTPS